MTKTSCLRTLLDIFSRYESYLDLGRLAVKIVGSILNIIIHLISTAQGKEQFLSLGGISILRHFCLNLDSACAEDKRWDRMIARTCTILTRCSQRKSLPLADEESPLQFHLPGEGQMQKSGKNFN